MSNGAGWPGWEEDTLARRLVEHAEGKSGRHITIRMTNEEAKEVVGALTIVALIGSDRDMSPESQSLIKQIIEAQNEINQ